MAIVAAKLPRMLLEAIHEREIVAFLTFFCHFGIFLPKCEINAHIRALGPQYSVSHIITYPSKELCSKMALGEGGVSLP